jgi:hypothetical protein
LIWLILSYSDELLPVNKHSYNFLLQVNLRYLGVIVVRYSGSVSMVSSFTFGQYKISIF